MTKKELLVKCPTCGHKFNYHDSEFRPFCREKCQLIDLGRWLEGDYAIPCSDPIDEAEKTDNDNDEESEN